MTDESKKEALGCRGDDVAAYLDCELGPHDSRRFEEHVRACESCAAALNVQKRLLRLLDVTLSHPSLEADLALPADFARVVTAHAQTDMSGVRAAPERRRALLLCAALAAVSLALFGAAFFGEGLGPVAPLARAAFGVLRMAGNAAADGVSSSASAMRAAGGRLASDMPAFKLLTWALVACAVVALLRLIGRPRRARG